MKKRNYIVLLMLLLFGQQAHGISLSGLFYTTPAFFSFFQKSPAQLFVGFCVFIFKRLPIVTKSELKRSEEEAKKEISTRAEKFKVDMLDTIRDHLEKETENCKKRIERLNEKIANIVKAEEKKHKDLGRISSQNSDKIDELSINLQKSDFRSKEIFDQLQKDKEEAEVKLQSVKEQCDKIGQKIDDYSIYLKKESEITTQNIIKKLKAHAIKLEEEHEKVMGYIYFPENFIDEKKSEKLATVVSKKSHKDLQNFLQNGHLENLALVRPKSLEIDLWE